MTTLSGAEKQRWMEAIEQAAGMLSDSRHQFAGTFTDDYLIGQYYEAGAGDIPGTRPISEFFLFTYAYSRIPIPTQGAAQNWVLVVRNEIVRLARARVHYFIADWKGEVQPTDLLDPEATRLIVEAIDGFIPDLGPVWAIHVRQEVNLAEAVTRLDAAAKQVAEWNYLLRDFDPDSGGPLSSKDTPPWEWGSNDG